MNKRSEFCDYLIDTIRVLSDGAKGTIYIEAFLRYIFQSDVLENVYLNADVASVLRQPGRHLGGGLNSEIIERIDLETFSKVVLAKKHSLFSIYNWSRDEKRDYMLNEVFLEF